MTILTPNKIKIKKQIRNSKKYKEWDKKVRDLGKETCVKCGDCGSHIQTHHIIPFNYIIKKDNIVTFKEAIKSKSLWDANNGECLCPFHHQIKHGMKIDG